MNSPIKKKKFRMRQETKDGWILLTPLLLLTIGFLFYPVASNFYYSLTRWKGLGDPVFIGLQNYKQMFQDERFYESMRNLGILVLYIPLGVLLPLLIANILRNGLKGWKIYRAMLYLPNILGPVILGTIFSVILSQVGPITEILNRIGFENANEIYLLGKSTSDRKSVV